MAESWLRAVAEVFVEVQIAHDAVNERSGERHLVALAAAPPEVLDSRSSGIGPKLVVVSLFGEPTTAELRPVVDAAAHVAQICADRDGATAGRVVVLGLEAKRRRRRRSRTEFEFVSSDGDLRIALDRSPHVLVTDASGFHKVPDSLLARSAIVGLDRAGDGVEYSQLFVTDAKSRHPEAMVSSGSIESLTEPKTNARQLPRELGETFMRIVESNADASARVQEPGARAGRDHARRRGNGRVLRYGTICSVRWCLRGKGTRPARGRSRGARGAQQMARDYWRTFAPPTLPNGLPNPVHLSVGAYRSRARSAATRSIRANRARDVLKRVSLTGAGTPTRVSVATEREHEVQILGAGASADRASGREITVRSRAVAELRFTFATMPGAMPANGSGGGYSGPLAYRQGKPMRPDVAMAFDRMAAAARRAGLSLVDQQRVSLRCRAGTAVRAHPDPKWVAPPGTSLHRYGTELDLGPPAAYGWLAANARRSDSSSATHGSPGTSASAPTRATSRRSTEPARTSPRTAATSAPPACRPGCPQRFRQMIVDAAQRHNVQPVLLAAQLKAESDFNPNAVSPAGAQGIAQFMPGTARVDGPARPIRPARSRSTPRRS